MKKLLPFLLFCIFLSSSVFSEESKKFIVFIKMYALNCEMITVTPESYILKFEPGMINSQYQLFIIDDITGDNLAPVELKGYKLGTWSSEPFEVIVPRSYKKLYFYGIMVFGMDREIDLTPYDKYVTARIQRKGLDDNKKPIININYPILKNKFYRTEKLFVTVEGKVTDNLGVLNLQINDESTAISNNGIFKKRLKLKIGKNTVLLKATDINNNVSKTDFVIIRDEIVQDTQFSDVDFPKATSNINKNTIAVVFGIENYRNAPTVSFAVNDADIFREYLIKRFGLKRENIYLRLDEQATKAEFDKVFSPNGWIARNSSKATDVIIYFAGHGAPDIKTKSSFIIPHDGDANYASIMGYKIKDIYSNLGSLKVHSVTVVMDACFSGISRDNQPLLADSRPINISVESDAVAENVVVFSAASGSQISSSFEQKKHGIFTYFFLKGLSGDADGNRDKEITVAEMQDYLSDNVAVQARKMGREQTPQLHGQDRDRVLLRY